MKVVKFSNGKYGVRRFCWFPFFWLRFKDFSPSGKPFWWSIRDSYFKEGDCFTDLETALAFARTTPVKVVEVLKHGRRY